MRAEPNLGAPAWASIAIATGALLANCALTPEHPDHVHSELSERIAGDAERPDGTDFRIPETISLEDGLDEPDAVAIALWNSPAFRKELAALGFARADLIQAGLLTNPVLTALFPLGDKQFEAALGWAVEGLWTRPRRAAIAQANWRKAADGIVATGLDLARDVRIAFADATATRLAAGTCEQIARLSDRRAAIDAARVRVGQVSDLDAAVSAADAVSARARAQVARYDAGQALLALRRLLGADSSTPPFELAPTPLIARPPSLEQALQRSAQARPELRAAELEIESAAERLGWERWRILRLTVLLDANNPRATGFEAGPGVQIELPLFDWNQAGVARAESEVERAAWHYVATQRQIASEVSLAHAAWLHADSELARHRDTALPGLELSASIAREGQRRGSVSHTRVLEIERALLESRLKEFELDANRRRALARLERSIGRSLNAP